MGVQHHYLIISPEYFRTIKKGKRLRDRPGMTLTIAKQFDNMATVRKMKEIVPEYKSNNSVYEVLDK